MRWCAAGEPSPRSRPHRRRGGVLGNRVVCVCVVVRAVFLCLTTVVCSSKTHDSTRYASEHLSLLWKWPQSMSHASKRRSSVVGIVLKHACNNTPSLSQTEGSVASESGATPSLQLRPSWRCCQATTDSLSCFLRLTLSYTAATEETCGSSKAGLGTLHTCQAAKARPKNTKHGTH